MSTIDAQSIVRSAYFSAGFTTPAGPPPAPTAACVQVPLIRENVSAVLALMAFGIDAWADERPEIVVITNPPRTITIPIPCPFMEVDPNLVQASWLAVPGTLGTEPVLSRWLDSSGLSMQLSRGPSFLAGGHALGGHDSNLHFLTQKSAQVLGYVPAGCENKFSPGNRQGTRAHGDNTAGHPGAV